jgi:hypothetical protein
VKSLPGISLVRGTFKYKQEFDSKKLIHTKKEKSCILLFSVVPVNGSALVPMFWKFLNSSFEESFWLLVSPISHSCKDLIIVSESPAHKNYFSSPNKW